jgi:hypothetical protein
MAIAVCNGSFKEGRGSLAWVLEGDSNQHRLVGGNIVPGNTSDHSAYRSELAGILGVVMLVSELVTFY